MELQEPKRKKTSKLHPNYSLPIILNKKNAPRKIDSFFNGFNVIVDDPQDMKNIISMGYFGKANFSRSYPQFNDEHKAEIIRKRQYEYRRKLSESNSNKKAIKKVIVVPDSDNEELDEYLTEIKPEFQLDKSGVSETVWLSLEEAFFLNYSINCLNIFYNSTLLSYEKCWELFSKSDPFFQYNYVAYYYFRSKNWVVKPGVKFGGDYLLYKQGPAFYHASVMVIIDILNWEMRRIENLTRRKMDNLTLLALNRLCETAAKELMVLQIVLPKDGDETEVKFNNLEIYSVKEILMKRWSLNQENNR